MTNTHPLERQARYAGAALWVMVMIVAAMLGLRLIASPAALVSLHFVEIVLFTLPLGVAVLMDLFWRRCPACRIAHALGSVLVLLCMAAAQLMPLVQQPALALDTANTWPQALACIGGWNALLSLRHRLQHARR